VLDDCREALDPVAVVGVEHAFDGVHPGVVDVAADHAVGAAPPGFARHRVLEFRDVADRAPDLELEKA